MLVTTLGYGANVPNARVAHLHAALEQNTRTNTLEIGEVNAAFVSLLRIFDRPRWWEKTEIP